MRGKSLSDRCLDLAGYFFERPRRLLVLAATLGFGAFLGYKTIGNSIDYSQGTRVGVINKLSEKGLISSWKTYEGEMALEGLVGGQRIGANLWHFSLDKEARHGENTSELLEKLRQYQEAGVSVKVDYIEQLATWPWRGSTSYFVQNVEPLKRPN